MWYNFKRKFSIKMNLVVFPFNVKGNKSIYGRSSKFYHITGRTLWRGKINPNQKTTFHIYR